MSKISSNNNQPKDIEINSDESSKSTCDSESHIDMPLKKNDGGPNTPSRNISNILNDHCLITIFEYLSLHDLCSVAEVCKIFQSNAIFVFARNFSNFDVNILIKDINWDNDDYDYEESDQEESDEEESDEEESDEEESDDFPLDLVEKVFRNFGIYIHSIHLDQDDFNEKQRDQILELMATFCSKKNAELNKLVLHEITISGSLVQSLQPLFARLKCLDITGGAYDFRNTPLFSACSELNELILDSVNFSSCFKQEFGKLERITLADVREVYPDTYVRALSDFVTMNPQLISLTITDSDGSRTPLSSNFYSLVGSMSDLEELNLHTNMNILHKNVTEDLNHLAQLNHLKSFSLNCLWLPVEQLFNNFAERNIPIEDLDLRNFSLDSNIATSLSKLTQMRSIRFYDGKTKCGQLAIAVKGMLHLQKLWLCNFEHVTVDDIIGVVQNGSALNELQLYHQNNIVIGVKEFNEIVQVIKNREHNNILNLNITGDRCEFNVPANLVEKNSSWLKVQVSTFNHSSVIDIMEYYQDSDEDEYDGD